jgi:Protein of unknown function (DUF998)
MARTATAERVTAISRTAAQLSLAAAAMFLVLLAALHLIKPELDPSWRFISEYAIGDHGWIMAVAFFSFAAGYVALFIAIRSQTRTITGRIGLALLLVSAAGLAIGGIFTTDPITASKDALTTTGKLHSLGGTLGIAQPIAAAFISWTLARNPAWSVARRALLSTAGLALVAFLGSAAASGIMLSQHDGKFGPEVLVGWPNRLEVLAYSVWLMTVAWHAIQLRSQEAAHI